jgi:hypothetical protein
MSERPSPIWELTLVFLVALVPRAVVALALPLTANESASLLDTWWPALWVEEERFFNPPLWRMAILVTHQFADNLLFGRLLAAVLSAAACATVTAALLRPCWGQPFGRMAAIVAGVGLATTPWAIVIGGQARSYGLALLATTWLMVSLLALWHRPTARRNMLAAVALGVAAWSHYILLLWLVPWLVVVVATTRRAGRSEADRERARMARLEHLKTRSGTGLFLGATLTVLPIYWAANGLALKHAMKGASVALEPAQWLAELHPEPWLAAVALYCGWRAIRSTRQRLESSLAIVCALLALVIVLLRRDVATVRWVHMVAVAPGLWLGAAVLVDRCNAKMRHGVSLALMAGGLLAATSVCAEVSSGHHRTDSDSLVGWIETNRPANVAAYAVNTDGSLESVAEAVLYDRGGYGDNDDRCIGADRVHLQRCRRRARGISGARCRALCGKGTCLWHLASAPEPWKQSGKPAGVDCHPAILVARHGATIAAINQTATRHLPDQTDALFEHLDLPLAEAKRYRTVRVGRWYVLTPKDPR